MKYSINLYNIFFKILYKTFKNTTKDLKDYNFSIINRNDTDIFIYRHDNINTVINFNPSDDKIIRSEIKNIPNSEYKFIESDEYHHLYTVLFFIYFMQYDGIYDLDSFINIVIDETKFDKKYCNNTYIILLEFYLDIFINKPSNTILKFHKYENLLKKMKDIHIKLSEQIIKDNMVGGDVYTNKLLPSQIDNTIHLPKVFELKIINTILKLSTGKIQLKLDDDNNILEKSISIPDNECIVHVTINETYDYFIMITKDKCVIDIFNVIELYFKNKSKYNCLNKINPKIKTNHAAANILLLWYYYNYYKNSEMSKQEIISFMNHFKYKSYLTSLYITHRLSYEIFIRGNINDKKQLKTSLLFDEY